MVAGEGLEPSASWVWARRAAAAPPRYGNALGHNTFRRATPSFVATRSFTVAWSFFGHLPHAMYHFRHVVLGGYLFSGSDGGGRTLIGRLSVVTGYKPAALPLSYVTTDNHTRAGTPVAAGSPLTHSSHENEPMRPNARDHTPGSAEIQSASPTSSRTPWADTSVLRPPTRSRTILSAASRSCFLSVLGRRIRPRSSSQ